MEEMVDLVGTDFGENHVNTVKDIFVFQSFAGLSYAELRKLGPDEIIMGWTESSKSARIGKKLVVMKRRQFYQLLSKFSESTRIIPYLSAAENVCRFPVMRITTEPLKS